jgi:hypothetical protein
MLKKLLKNAVKNVKQGWFTTLIGVSLVIGGPISVFTLEKVTWTEASVAMLLGLAFMFAPDKLVDKSTKSE